jgi:hypothetical protein
VADRTGLEWPHRATRLVRQITTSAPPLRPESVGRSLDEVVGELTAWSAAAAGLRADEGWLRMILGRADGEAGARADDVVFELVKALGLTRIGRTLPWSLPALDWPFSGVMNGYGPGFWAGSYAKARAAGEEMPVLPWEPQALALEAELWAALYRPAIDVAALARRAAYLLAAQKAAPKPWETTTAPATDRPVLDQIDLDLLASLESRLASGAAPGWTEVEARRDADSRTTDPATADSG